MAGQTGFQSFGFNPSPTGTGTYDTGSTDDSSGNTNWLNLVLNNSAGILGGAAQIIAATKTTNGVYGTVPATPTAPAPTTFPWIWVILAVVVLGALMFMSKK